MAPSLVSRQAKTPRRFPFPAGIFLIKYYVEIGDDWGGMTRPHGKERFLFEAGS